MNMVYFTQQQLERLTQKAALEGREGELRVLLGTKPLIRKYTYQLEHKKNGVEDELILLNNTKTILEGVISTLEKVPSLEDPRATAIAIANIHLRDISLGDRISLPTSVPPASTASAASPTESQALIILNESRALIPHPSHSHDRKLDWTVNPHAIHHIHEKYVESRIREQQHLIEVTLANKKASTEEVIAELRGLVEDLSKPIDRKEKELEKLKKQIAEKKQDAEKAYHEHANGWFEHVKQIIRERLQHTLILTEISIKDNPDEEQVELAEREIDKHVSPQIRRKIITELKAQQQSRPIPIPGAREDSTTALEPEESPSLLDALKQANVDINCIDSYGNALVALAMRPSLEVETSVMLAIVEYLTQGGAELEYPDNNGVTPARKALALDNNHRGKLFNVIAERKIQDVEYPLHPDIAWYLERQQALKDVGPRRVKARAEKYIDIRSARVNANLLYRAWRAGYELVFENEKISQHRPIEARWLSERSSQALLDGDHKSYTQDVRTYKDKHAEFGPRGEEHSDLWKGILEEISAMEIGKYGDREVAITYLDSIEHRSLGATVQELKKEREEDKAARRAQETKIEAQAIAIEQLQEQVAQLLLASASAPSPLAARAEADDRREATQIAERVPRVLHPSDEESQTASEETGAGNEAKPPLPVQSTDSLNMGS